MSVKSGKQLKRMLNQGWNKIIADPTIDRVDFNTWLEANTNFTRQDWNFGFNILTEMGHFTGNETFGAIKKWVTVGTTKPQRRAIREGAELYFNISPIAQIVLLTNQRAAIVTQRNDVRDSIQLALTPFINTPPAGVDTRVIDGVKDYKGRLRVVRDQFNESIVVIDAKIAELQAIINDV